MYALACNKPEYKNQVRMRQPVLNIHQMKAMHIKVNRLIAPKLNPIDTSAWPKKAHLKPEIK